MLHFLGSGLNGLTKHFLQIVVRQTSGEEKQGVNSNEGALYAFLQNRTSVSHLTFLTYLKYSLARMSHMARGFEPQQHASFV